MHYRTPDLRRIAALVRRYARSRGLLWAVLACVPLAIVVALLPTWIPLVLSTNQSSIRTTSLVGLIPALIFSRTFEVSLSGYEAIFVRSLRWLRLAHLGIAGGASGLFIVGAVAERVSSAAWIGGWFGALGFIGLGLAGSAMVRGPSWLVPGFVAGSMYLMGSAADGRVRFWAWYLFADPSFTKMAIDAALFLLGGLLLLYSRRFQPGG